MPTDAIIESIVNSEALVERFDGWPSFHDAEVLAVRLRVEASGKPCLEADIHLFTMTDEVDQSGALRLTNHTTATFWFEGVRGLALDGFEFQNVLWDLSIEDARSDQQEGMDWQVAFEASVGVQATFHCATIAVLAVAEYVPPSTPPTAHPDGIQSGPRPGSFGG